jgi:GntR family transcriptional regulator, rspAB operon transcriptional repressor
MRESDRAYALLHEDILGWKLAPGTVLGEADVSQQFGLSRTPIREALRRLEREKLVQIRPGRGAVVTEISLDSIAQLFQMREAIETYAARLAARKGDSAVFGPLLEQLEALSSGLDPTSAPEDGYAGYSALVARFDHAIEAAANNTYLSDALSNVTAHVARLRHLARRNPSRMYEASREHVAICRAIIARDANLAADLTAKHIHSSLQGILTVFIEDVTGGALMTSEPGLAESTA